MANGKRQARSPKPEANGLSRGWRGALPGRRRRLPPPGSAARSSNPRRRSREGVGNAPPLPLAAGMPDVAPGRRRALSRGAGGPAIRRRSREAERRARAAIASIMSMPEEAQNRRGEGGAGLPGQVGGKGGGAPTTMRPGSAGDGLPQLRCAGEGEGASRSRAVARMRSLEPSRYGLDFFRARWGPKRNPANSTKKASSWRRLNFRFA